MTEPRQREETAQAPSEQQILTDNLGHLARLLQIAHGEMERKLQGEQTPPSYFVVIISPDGQPRVEEVKTMDGVCAVLSELRAQITELANAPADEDDEDEDDTQDPLTFWAYVFQGQQLALSIGRVWQVGDGERTYDVDMPAVAPSHDGAIRVPIPVESDPADVPADDESR